MYCVTLYLFFIRWWYNLNEFLPNLTSNLCPSNSTSRISNLTGHEILVKLGGNSLYASLVKLGIIPMNSTGIYLNGFTPNLTGWIGCKSIEIMTTKFNQACNVISMNLHPNLTGRIWPVEFGCKFIEIDASWIHWDDTQFNQAGIQCNLSEFTPIFSSISCLIKFEIQPVEFDQSNWE